MKVGVIGAGPAGITAAFELVRRGVEVEVFEADAQVGGLARTITLWGHKVDLGPHRFFSKDPRVNAVWHGVVGPDHRMVDRLTRIYYDGKFYDYPLKPANALRNMGWGNALACLASYGWQMARNLGPPGPRATFEDWAVAAFGRKLFAMFFQAYSEKLWGIACDELDADFAAQRIKRFSLGAAVLGAIGLDPSTHQTLAGRFAHPLGGSGMAYERMAAQVAARGGRVHLARPVLGLGADGRSLLLADGSARRFDHIVSTMPLTALVRSAPGVPGEVAAAADKLTYRSTVVVYLRVASPALFPDQWLYIQSPELRVGRITNFRNWAPEAVAGSTDTVLALEYWCDQADAAWAAADAEWVATAAAELRQSGLDAGATVRDGQVVRLPACYPVYRRGYRQWLAPLVAYLRERLPHVSAIGRYGAFKYNNQDHSILMGILAAENIAAGATHDLWGVNTDYGSYQEEAAG